MYIKPQGNIKYRIMNITKIGLKRRLFLAKSSLERSDTFNLFDILEDLFTVY